VNAELDTTAASSVLKTGHATDSFNTSIAYIGLVLIWSTTPLSVVLSLRELNPIWSLTIRFLLALMVARGILWLLKEPLPMDRAAIRCYLAGSFSLFWAMLFTYLGAQYLPSGLISLIYGLSPLVAGFLAHVVFKSQRLSFIQWAGMFIAVLGLAAIFGAAKMQGHIVVGIIYVLLGVLCYVGSIFWLRYENNREGGVSLHSLAQTTGSLLLSGIGLLVLIPFYWGQRPVEIPSWLCVSAILYSATFASVLAMFCYFYLVSRVKPATLSLTTVMTPILAMALGMWINHEHLTWSMLTGAAIVLAGLILYFAPDWWRVQKA
jgi:drug/metabolite transporter (DMT)-like permease